MFDKKHPKTVEAQSKAQVDVVGKSSGFFLRPKGIITNATWNSSFTVWTVMISFVLTPIMIRHLGLSEYGILLLIWSVTGVMGTMNLGLGEGTLRYVAYHYNEQDMAGINRVFGATLSLFCVLCILISASIFMMSPFMVQWLNIPPAQHHEVSWLLRLSALAVSISIIQGLYATIPSALQHYEIGIKIGLAGSVARTGGYIALAVSGHGIIYIIVWDLLVSLTLFYFFIRAARTLLPKLQLRPQFSFLGLLEIAGYSISSFLTFLFHKLHRESGKLLIARYLGPTPVVYLATPDNIAQRFHEIVASGIEATLPRFSTDRKGTSGEPLFWDATWAGIALSLILLVPFFVLIPDFLTLWINSEFATHSGLIGQLLAIYLVSQGAFAAPAAYFRGIGKPWFVTLVIFFSLIITTLTAVVLVPKYGAKGAAYAYLAGSVSPFLGTVLGSVYAFGWSSFTKIVKVIVLPLVAGILAAYIGMAIRNKFGTLSWMSLFASGIALLILSTVLVVGADWLTGDKNTSSRKLFDRLKKSRKFGFVFGGRG